MPASDYSEYRFVSNKIAAISNIESRLELSSKPLIQASKPLFVFVHGFLDNANSFAYLLPYLSHYQCIAIDLAGHGKSAHRSEDAHYHLSDYVYDLHCLIEEAKWRNVHLVGHSLGGIICSIYAACFPENVKRVFSIESCGPLTESASTSCQQLRDSIESRLRAQKPIKQPANFEQIVDARLRISDLSREHAACILQRNTQYIDGQLCWQTDKRLRTKSSMRFTQEQALNVIENIQCPYHLILGTKGFDKVKRLFEQRGSLFKTLDAITLEGGHHVHMESAESLAEYINDSLKN